MPPKKKKAKMGNGKGKAKTEGLENLNDGKHILFISYDSENPACAHASTITTTGNLVNVPQAAIAEAKRLGMNLTADDLRDELQRPSDIHMLFNSVTTMTGHVETSNISKYQLTC